MFLPAAFAWLITFCSRMLPVHSHVEAVPSCCSRLPPPIAATTCMLRSPLHTVPLPFGQGNGSVRASWTPQLRGLGVCTQEATAALGDLPPPLTASGPANITGELDLTQSLVGPPQTAAASSRGLTPAGPSNVNIAQAPTQSTAGR